MLTEKYRLKKPQEFRHIYQQGKSIAGKYLVLYAKQNHMEFTRFGFSVSKKIGKAVVRNKIKRRLREICRQHQNQLRGGYDLIFIARIKIKGIRYSLVEHEIMKLCAKAGLLI